MVKDEFIEFIYQDLKNLAELLPEIDKEDDVAINRAYIVIIKDFELLNMYLFTNRQDIYLMLDKDDNLIKYNKKKSMLTNIRLALATIGFEILGHF